MCRIFKVRYIRCKDVIYNNLKMVKIGNLRVFSKSYLSIEIFIFLGIWIKWYEYE